MRNLFLWSLCLSIAFVGVAGAQTSPEKLNWTPPLLQKFSAPDQRLDAEVHTDPVAGGGTPAGVVQMVPNAGAAPLGICHDSASNLILVVGLFDGLTQRYTPQGLAFVDSIPSPGGTLTTTGITQADECNGEGPNLFWACPGDGTFYRTDLNGVILEANALSAPGGGLVGGIAATDGVGIWMNDIVSDQYSLHNQDGVATGDVIAHPTGGFGNGVAFVGGGVGGLELPVGDAVDGQVVDLSHVCYDGTINSTVDIAALDTFINGNEWTEAGVGLAMGNSSWIVGNSANMIFEIDSIAAGSCLGAPADPACPPAFIPPEPFDKAICQIAGEITNSYLDESLGISVESSTPGTLVPDRLYSSAPALPISTTLPPTTDTINVADGGNVADVDLGLDITHTWRGDLEIRLTSPNGTTGLHLDNQGGSADDVIVIFDDEGAPFDASMLADGIAMVPHLDAMSVHDGQPKAGDWTIEITDTAGGDDGTLNSWDLNIDNLESPPISNTLPPTVDTIEFTTAGAILDLNVGVNITHTWLGDISIDLTSPAMTAVTLKAAGGGNFDDVAVIFDDEGVPYDISQLANGLNMQPEVGPLSLVDGEDQLGIWTLSVIDGVGGDNGTLNSWALIVSGLGPDISNTLPPTVATLNVPDSTTVFDLDVGLQITHTWIGDMEMTLTSPAMTSALVWDNFGGSNDNVNVILDDEGVAADPVVANSGANMQTPNDDLSIFDGEDSAGDWTMSIIDTAGGDDGNFNGFALFVSTGGLVISTTLPITTDTMTVPNYGIIADLNVGLDITHTWSGDVIIDVSSPAGTVVRLANAEGGSVDFAPTVYNDDGDEPTDQSILDMIGALGDTVPFEPLSTFDKEEKGGDWSVIIEDVAAGDDGTLGLWCLVALEEATYEECFAPARTEETSEPGLTIDAATPTVSDVLTSAAGLIITDLDVSVDITHTFSGDLELSVTSPLLTTAILSDNAGGSADDILVTFDDEGIAFDATQLAAGVNMQPQVDALSVFDGEASDGDWTFDINDTFPNSDDGVWNSWGLSYEVLPAIIDDPVVTSVDFADDFIAINDVNIGMNITHAFVGDLAIDIEHNGIIVTLHNGGGGSNDDLLVTFDDAGIPNGTPYNADVHMQPSGPGALADFNADLIGGTWTMTIDDTFGGSGDGALNGWCATVAGREPDCMPAAINSISADVTTGNAPVTVNFASDVVGTDPIVYAWDFGDGGVSADANPAYTYVTPGLYTVTLTVTNDCGDATATLGEQIVVTTAPTAGFSAAPTFGVAPLIVDFSDASTGDVDTYDWDFGDGGAAADANPQYTYNTPGTYDVSQTVTGNGDSDTDTQAGLITALGMGDCNGDGFFGLADIIFEANYLFVPGSPVPSCPVTCNMNGDALLNLGDAVFGLNALFVPGSPPVAGVPAGTPCAFP